MNHEPLEPELLEMEAELRRLQPLEPDFTILQRLTRAMEPEPAPALHVLPALPAAVPAALPFWASPASRWLPAAAAAAVCAISVPVSLFLMRSGGSSQRLAENAAPVVIDSMGPQTTIPGFQPVKSETRPGPGREAGVVRGQDGQLYRRVLVDVVVRQYFTNTLTGETVWIDRPMQEVRLEPVERF